MTGSAIYYTLVARVFCTTLRHRTLDSSVSGHCHYSYRRSIGQAGVPGPTLLVVAVLVSAGIPIEGLPLLYALDRVVDMLRTLLNITGDAACAVIVDRK
jgi:Na+/H+-dicarboxylate symporter